MVAKSTARLLEGEPEFTYVLSGYPSMVQAHEPGEDDLAVALYIESLRTIGRGRRDRCVRRIRNSPSGRKLIRETGPDRLPSDLDLAVATDAFPFAMMRRRAGGVDTLVARAAGSPESSF